MRVLAAASLALGAAATLRVFHVSSPIVSFPLLIALYVVAVVLPALPYLDVRHVRESSIGVVCSTFVWIPFWVKGDAPEVGVFGALVEAFLVDVLPALVAVGVAVIGVHVWRAARATGRGV
jgi:hypothetical protein